MKQIDLIEKKIENLMRNLTILLSEKLQKRWLCRHIFMANSPLVEIGDRVAHLGTNQSITHLTLLAERFLKNLFVRSAGQETACLSRKPKAYYRVHKGKPPVPTLGQINPTYALKACYLR
jgi:hypothetical protein